MPRRWLQPLHCHVHQATETRLDQSERPGMTASEAKISAGGWERGRRVLCWHSLRSAGVEGAGEKLTAKIVCRSRALEAATLLSLQGLSANWVEQASASWAVVWSNGAERLLVACNSANESKCPPLHRELRVSGPSVPQQPKPLANINVVNF